MAIEKSRLISPISLPISDDGKRGGTNGALDGATDAALDRGYKKVPPAEAAEDAPPVMPMDEGFLSRSRGWDR